MPLVTATAEASKLPAMAIQSIYLGPVTVSGDDAESFARKIAYGRGTKAAAKSTANGRKLVTAFSKMGSVAIELKSSEATAN
jgi:hypothetical protein